MSIFVSMYLYTHMSTYSFKEQTAIQSQGKYTYKHTYISMYD